MAIRRRAKHMSGQHDTMPILFRVKAAPCQHGAESRRHRVNTAPCQDDTLPKYEFAPRRCRVMTASCQSFVVLRRYRVNTASCNKWCCVNTTPSQLGGASGRRRVDATLCQDNAVPIRCRVNFIFVTQYAARQHGVVSRRCRVNRTPCQHGVVSKKKTAPCQHDPLSMRRRVNPMP